MKAILCSALVVLILGALGVMCQRVASRGRYMAPYSTLGAGPKGSQALFELTESLGHHPVRWMQDLEDLPKGGVLVALGDNEDGLEREVSHYEGEELDAWVRDGGILIVAGLPDYVPTSLDVRLTRMPDLDPLGLRDMPEVSSVAIAAVPELVGLPDIVLKAPVYLEGTDSSTALLRTSDGVAALEERVGKGVIIAVASGSPFQNESIVASGAALWSRLLTRFDHSPAIVFDEYHLGVGAERSIVGYVRGIGALPILLQLLVAFALLLWRLGARFGSPRAEVESPPGGTASYLSATGSLFAKSGDEGGATALLAKHALGRIARHYHAPSATPDRLALFLGGRAGGVPRASAVRLGELLKGTRPGLLIKTTQEIDELVARAVAESAV